MTLQNLDNSATNSPSGQSQASPWATETLLFTQLPYREAKGMQDEAFLKLLQGEAAQHQLLLLEHPPTYLVGEEVEEESLPLQQHGLTLAVAHSLSPRGVEYLGPGALAVYLTMNLEQWRRDVDAFADALGEIIVRTLADFGITGQAQPDGRAVLVGGQPIATLDVRLRRWVAAVRLMLHTNTDPEPLETARETLGAEAGVAPPATTMTQQGMPIERQDEVREAFLRHYEAVLGSAVSIPQREGAHTVKPPWLKARIPFAMGTERVHSIIGGQRLHTVCESAHCPNMGECWRHGTATFMINGNICTRSCSFCAIFTGRPQPLDLDEPRRVAEAARQMGIQYVVVTSVNRDELPDGGANQFAETIRLLREKIADVAIEVLIPDFRGVASAQDTVFAARPDVLNHNIETVPRLYKRVRPQGRFQRSLDLIKRAKAAGLVTKSGFMLGLGEEAAEIEQTLRDLRAHECDIVTIGQYLRPSEKHHPLIRYVTPTEFDHWREYGLSLGFKTVESGPLVRSSYHAHLSYRRHIDGNG